MWAIGEAAGSPQFTHVSVDDFRIVRDRLAGGDRSTRDRLVPYAMFSDPPLARVGLSERGAQNGKGSPAGREAADEQRVAHRSHGRDTRLHESACLGADDRILGFTMIGSEAGEVMAAMQTAILAELPYPKLRDAVITHLTFAEGFGPLLANVPPRATAQ